MDDKFEEVLYKSGLIAQGSWDKLDEYDRTAIRNLFEITIKDCISNIKDWEYDKSLII